MSYPTVPAEDSASSEQPKIRLFTAITFPPDVKEAIARCASKLQKGTQFTGAHPAWVKSDSIHITLVFLGWQPPGCLEAIERAMDAAVQRQQPFTLGVAGVHLFPTPKNPRVIAMDLTRDTVPLISLHRKLAQACCEQGFEVEERDYRPHLTLARIKSMKGLAGLRDVIRIHEQEDAGSFPVRSIECYQSILKADGAEYQEVIRREFA